MKALTALLDQRKARKGMHLFSVMGVVVLALLVAGVAFAFTVGNIDGVWSTIDTNGASCDTWATGSGPSSYSTSDPSIQTGSTTDINQVRYGNPSGDYYDCPSGSGTDHDKAEFNHQSGFGFDGNNGPVSPASNTPFFLGTFTHFNWPINADNSFDYVDLALTVPVTCNDNVTSTNFSFTPRFTLDETPNEDPCAYPGSPDCPDKVTVSTPSTASFTCPDGTYTVNILGFTTAGLGGDACNVSFNPAAVSNEFVTNESQVNNACLWAEISPTKLEVIKDLTASTHTDGLFNLQINGVTQAADVGDAGTTGILSQNIAVQTAYTVGETAGTGTDLGWYFKNVQCYNRNTDPYPPDTAQGNFASTNLLMNLSSVSFNLSPGQDVYCIITNADFPTAVTLASSSVEDILGVVNVEWATSYEQTGTVGFDVYRSDGSGEPTKVNSEMIVAKGNGSGGADYQVFDFFALPGKTYTYIIKLIDGSGASDISEETVTIFHYMKLPLLFK